MNTYQQHVYSFFHVHQFISAKTRLYSAKTGYIQPTTSYSCQVPDISVQTRLYSAKICYIKPRPIYSSQAIPLIKPRHIYSSQAIPLTLRKYWLQFIVANWLQFCSQNMGLLLFFCGSLIHCLCILCENCSQLATKIITKQSL